MKEKYIKTDNWNLATHWIPTYDNEVNFGNITIGNLYKIYTDKIDNEQYIFNDNGNQSLIFLCHNGDLVYFQTGLTKEKKELLRKTMGAASSKTIDLNKIREEFKYENEPTISK